jgi:hypothetical protein
MLMDRAERMREKRSSIAVKLIKLIKVYASNPGAVTCVFEGEDAKYYGIRLDSFLNGRERKNISCKGKGNLISLKKKVDLHEELSNANVLYFADRDFDLSDITGGNIYFTPCYSVENLYIEKPVLRRILLDEFGFCEIEDNEDVNSILNIYEHLLFSAANALLHLSAWIMCQNKASKSDSSIRLNLNNYDAGEFIDFDLENVFTKYDKEALKVKFPDSIEIFSDEIDTAQRLIEQGGIVKSIRGKYLLDFFRAFLEKIRSEISNEDSFVITKKIKTKLTISKNNILSDLSQYAETPNCLTNFLRIHLDEAA